MVQVVQNSIVLPRTEAAPKSRSDSAFLRAKRGLDVAVATAALVPLAVLLVTIWAINLRLNPGPLFFTQRRMGQDGRPFTIYKFRTMLPAAQIERGFDDPVEVDRITPFGALMRRTRVDELPQVLNILLGQMSLIGPRPDSYSHAVRFADLVPGYRERHRVRPGLTGLAQVSVGYAEGLDATARKVAADLTYIRDMSPLLDLRIALVTVWVVLSGHGAR
ncbi:sugar transferase [Acuticoccus sediminis]|uniref:sugar transferase n=1 Tax=Acuticoccus sediminis TaxID=2184697 RepID=UPI001CFF3D83|nr:sugar transferase [Acuticoccus sediminis]